MRIIRSIGIAAFAVVLAQAVACGGSSDDVGNGSSANLVPKRSNIAVERNSDHVPEGQNIDYRTIPPTSGQHWSRWADCGFYIESLPDERIVHNLEHGNIVVSYNLANPAQVTELRNNLEDLSLFEDWGVARPYDQIREGRVVLTAWGRMHSMTGVRPGEIERFFKTFAGDGGPERVRCRP